MRRDASAKKFATFANWEKRLQLMLLCRLAVIFIGNAELVYSGKTADKEEFASLAGDIFPSTRTSNGFDDNPAWDKDAVLDQIVRSDCQILGLLTTKPSRS